MNTKTFIKIADWGVAKFTGSSGLKLLDMFAPPDRKKLDDGHVTRTFEWDGYTIWSPCDCSLSANEWQTPSGNFIRRVDSKNHDSYATMYVFKCGSGVIFGNGGKLYYSDGYVNYQELLNASDTFNVKSINVEKRQGNYIILLKDFKSIDTAALTVFERSTPTNTFKEYNIPINRSFFNASKPYLSADSWNLLSFGNYQNNTFQALMYTTNYNAGMGTLSDLILINIKEKRALSSCCLYGIQMISKHPVEDVIVVLGKELSILSIPTLKVIKSVQLPVARDLIHYDKGCISYSSCGRYLALSYAVNGDIEIRDAQTLSIIHTFNGYGRPQPDMCWDITGSYLACRFITRENNKPVVIVWDVQSRRLVLQTDSSRTYVVPVAIRWAPDSSKLACLVNNQRIQIFE